MLQSHAKSHKLGLALCQQLCVENSSFMRGPLHLVHNVASPLGLCGDAKGQVSRQCLGHLAVQLGPVFNFHVLPTAFEVCNVHSTQRVLTVNIQNAINNPPNRNHHFPAREFKLPDDGAVLLYIGKNNLANKGTDHNSNLSEEAVRCVLI